MTKLRPVLHVCAMILCSRGNNALYLNDCLSSERDARYLPSENLEVKYTHARSWWPPAKAVQSVRKSNVTAVRGDRKTSQTKKRESRAHVLPSSCDTTHCNNWLDVFATDEFCTLTGATLQPCERVTLTLTHAEKLVQWHNFKRKSSVLEYLDVLCLVLETYLGLWYLKS